MFDRVSENKNRRRRSVINNCEEYITNGIILNARGTKLEDIMKELEKCSLSTFGTFKTNKWRSKESIQLENEAIYIERQIF